MFKTSSAKLYQRNKEKLPKKLSKRNQDLSEKAKNKRNGCEWYKNLSEDEKKKKASWVYKYY